MRRNYKLTVSYDGTRYQGWEHQPDTEMTIQGKLETVLTGMLAAERGEGVPVEKLTVIGAGRTDAGVHARAMVCNVLLDTAKDEAAVQAYLNRYLPEDISVNSVKHCADRFHSRFKATGKVYRYTCWCADAKPVFDRRYVTVLDEMPDIERMRAAAALLKGMHDFRSFCGNSRMSKSTVRTLYDIRIEKSGGYVRFYFHGNGFLQNMVRILVGTLLETGYGRREPEEMTDLLEAGNRRLAGFTAPAKGLCLMKVEY
ncbi:MAG: tRNA pseudouridine(38-40) synthase TruA [Lachnospiraceae bacterium]|nr:tRNA pseudouridine(38-40) synthase TruA [Lachnospiraceae bacterium]